MAEASTSQGATANASSQLRNELSQLSDEAVQREYILKKRLKELHGRNEKCYKIHKGRKTSKPPPRIRQRLGGIIKSVNIDTVDFNFPVEEDLSSIIQNLLRQRLTNIGYDGALIPIGSTYDRTRVSADTDLDYLYVLTKTPKYNFSQPENITVKETDDGAHMKKVCIGGDELDPFQIYKDFADRLNEEFRRLRSTDLHDSLVFGGFAKPEFSGVRHNEPAVTLLFVHKNNSGENQEEEFSVDITIALELPVGVAHRLLVDEIKRTEYRRNQILDETTQTPLHLVPVWPYEKLWYLTTSVFEQHIFRNVSNDQTIDVIRKTVKLCKAKAKQVSKRLDESFHQIVNVQQQPRPERLEKFHRLQNWLKDTVEDYHKYLSSRNTNTVYVNELVQELQKTLQDVFSVAHTVLHNRNDLPRNESRSRCVVSFNSSAFKYLTLTSLESVQQQPGEHGDCCSLILDKFIHDDKIEHTFLKYDVRSICVHPAVLSKLDDIVSALVGHNE